MGNRPRAVDLFAGAGGMSLGFEQAGFDVIAAAELDPIHASTHLFNFPNCAVLAKSVSALTGHEIEDAASVPKGSVDVVFGGPPCQGFSLMGQRMLDDPRNELVKDFLRIVVELDASYFVFENVKGLTVGRQRRFLQALIDLFGESGYDTLRPYRVLNAKHFGVPQDRERLFLIGCKKGLPLPAYPEPFTEVDPRAFGALALKPTPTCKEALDDLPDIERFDELNSHDWVRYSNWKPKTAFAQEMHCVSEESWRYGHKRNWDPAVLTSSRRTRHTEISRRRFERTAPGEVEPISRFFKLHPRGISNTLRAGTDSARGAFTSPRPIHYAYPRCVSVREMARLHGYPDWFRFHVTKWHGARQIGNSVPPPLARSVAASIVRAMNIEPAAPPAIMPLGDPALLEMVMTDASDFWHVDVPIARRNKKSGARKRKQHEIELEIQSARKP